jgi:hypothetical protein
VTNEPSVFTVLESGERTIVAFRDWPSSREMYFSLDPSSFLVRMRTELNDVINEYQCKVLAIDMTPVTVMPSPLLGLLTLVYKRGIRVQLLHPSELVREALDAAKLNQLFAVHD